MSSIDKLKEVREEIKRQQEDLKNCEYHLNAAISSLEGHSVRVTITEIKTEDGNEKATHPDLPPISKIPPMPPTEPPKVEKTKTEKGSPPRKFDKKKPYRMVTTRSAILHLLGVWRGRPLSAVKIAEQLQAGGWGKDLKDPVASARATLSAMRMELKVTQIDNLNHYELHPVEET